LSSSIAIFSASTTEASAMAMVPVSECRIPTFTTSCACAPRGQMNGAGRVLAAATAALVFMNFLLLSFISLLSLFEFPPVRAKAARTKKARQPGRTPTCGLPCHASP